MPIAITDEHRQLGEIARAFLRDHDALTAGRRLLEAEQDELPHFWAQLADLGWLGLHLPEDVGGSGYSLEEIAVVIEEMGRVLAPGPFLPSVWSSAVINRSAPDDVRQSLLPGLADGSAIGAVAIGRGVEISERNADGQAGPTLGAELATVLLVIAGEDVVVIDPRGPGVEIRRRRNLDPTRRAADVRLDGAPVLAALTGAARHAVAVGRALAAAEAAGGASACVQAAAEYAKVREQFGRVIGAFQAVKHHAANMFVAAELATAAAWDPVRAEDLDEQFEFAAAVAGAQALPAFVMCAQTNIQLHGGIGYTWEHDAHLYLRRAGALASLFGPVSRLREEVVDHAARGVRRDYAVTLPPEAEQFRAGVREFVAGYRAAPESDRLGLLLDNGYVNPHWPAPWGRGAGPVEQLVIDEEFGAADVRRPSYGIGGWIIQTLIQHASEPQVARWIRPSLEGELQWCQLFSEPDAGSDAASIRTRGTRVDGGWLVDGQKIWTSGAQHCNRGWATVRTDPDAAKHSGITMMVIDMTSPDVEVRPLREASGGALFSEVFFNGYFVPDDDVVGTVNSGWTAARSTLGNERVSIGGGLVTSGGGVDLLDIVATAVGDTARRQAVGQLLAENQSMSLLNLRTTERAVVGGEPGPEGNVAKLLNGEHAQRGADLALLIGGPDAAYLDGELGGTGSALIYTRCLTIAGGTSEIVRSQIGERILGLPRDPLIS